MSSTPSPTRVYDLITKDAIDKAVNEYYAWVEGGGGGGGTSPSEMLDYLESELDEITDEVKSRVCDEFELEEDVDQFRCIDCDEELRSAKYPKGVEFWCCENCGLSTCVDCCYNEKGYVLCNYCRECGEESDSD